MNIRTLSQVSTACALALAAQLAQAQVTIDQNKALAGGITAGDSAGYPITISQRRGTLRAGWRDARAAVCVGRTFTFTSARVSRRPDRESRVSRRAVDHEVRTPTPRILTAPAAAPAGVGAAQPQEAHEPRPRPGVAPLGWDA